MALAIIVALLLQRLKERSQAGDVFRIHFRRSMPSAGTDEKRWAQYFAWFSLEFAGV